MDESWRICISSPPDREKLVAEIFLSDQQWGEINQEGSDLEIEVYPRQDKQPWKVNYDNLINTLNEAKKRLIK